MREAFYDCPSFEICQVNGCPLSSKFGREHITLAEDKLLWNYKKCRQNKKKRMAIASKYNLENKGLFPQERAGMERWNNLTPEQQEAKKHKLAETSPFIRLKSKGYAIIPKKQDVSTTHTQNDINSPQNEAQEQDSGQEDENGKIES